MHDTGGRPVSLCAVIDEGKRIGRQMSTLEANKALARRFYG
jgi:hypothetical protein